MRSLSPWAVLAATLCLAGCHASEDDANSGPRGQGPYLGIGLYEPGALWSRLTAAAPAKDATRANLHDDEQVIVTVDSRTGEVRQCGNLSGYCISMNPWQGPLGQEQNAPLAVSEHRADLERKAQQAEKELKANSGKN